MRILKWRQKPRAEVSGPPSYNAELINGGASLLWIDYTPAAFSLEIEPDRNYQKALSGLLGMPVSGFTCVFTAVLESIPDSDVVIIIKGRVVGRLSEVHAERIRIALRVHGARGVQCFALVHGGKTEGDAIVQYSVSLAMSLECPVVFRPKPRIAA